MKILKSMGDIGFPILTPASGDL
ncbi:hypothetical protein AYI69_g8556, partial [Smittium culicis]